MFFFLNVDFKSCEVFHMFTMCGLKSCEYGEQRNLMGLGGLWGVKFHTHKTFRNNQRS